MRGHSVGQVAGRGACDDVVAELARLRERDADDTVLERMRRVGGVVLDVHLPDSQSLGQALGAHERREARLERDARAALEGQEVGIAPDRVGTGLDLAPELGGVAEPGMVVGDLERSEAEVTAISCVERRFLAAFFAFEGGSRHLCLLEPKNLRLVLWRRLVLLPPPHLPGLNWSLLELAPFSPLAGWLARKWLPGLHRASPSTPLDA